MKIEVNLEKKYFFAVLSAVIIFAALIGVYAYGTSNPSVFGHSAAEIEGGIAGGIVLKNSTTQITTHPAVWQWTTLLTLTTTATSGTVLINGQAYLLGPNSGVGFVRIIDSNGKVIASLTLTDYADTGAVAIPYKFSLTGVDTLSGSAKTYYLQGNTASVGKWGPGQTGAFGTYPVSTGEEEGQFLKIVQ